MSISFFVILRKNVTFLMYYNYLLVLKKGRYQKMNLTSKELNTYEVIEKIIKKEITRKEAMFKLKKSRQQIYRLIKIYNEQGEQGFIHKNRRNIPPNKIEQKIIDELKQLYLDEYYDYNLVAFYDELNENKKYKGKYGVSYSTLYNAFLSDDIISPIAHKETIKLYNEKKRIMQLLAKKLFKKKR